MAALNEAQAAFSPNLGVSLAADLTHLLQSIPSGGQSQPLKTAVNHITPLLKALSWLPETPGINPR